MAIKVGGALVAVFLIFYVLTSPHQAHDIAEGIGHLVATIAKGLRNFVNSFT